MQTQIESSGIDYSEVVKCFLRDLEAIPPISKTGLTPLGLPLTDYLIGGGLRPGEVSLIAGISNIGKSSLAAHVTQNVAVQEQQRVLVYTLQKTISAFMLSVLSADKKLNRNTLERAVVGNPQWEKLSLCNRWGTYGSIRLQDSAGLDSLEELAHSIESTQADSFDPSLIVIDNLQMLVGGEDDGDSLQSVICDLKRIATKNQVAILLISHVNVQTQVPFVLHRLVDSAFVLAETKNRHEIQCVKNAHGGAFSVPLDFVVEQGCFKELRDVSEVGLCSEPSFFDGGSPISEELEVVNRRLQENRSLLIRHGHFFGLEKRLNGMVVEFEGASEGLSFGVERRTRQRIQQQFGTYAQDVERIIEACRLNTTFECSFNEAAEVLGVLMTTEEVAYRLGLTVAQVEGLMRKAGFKRVRIPYASSGYPRIFWTEEAYEMLAQRELN